MLVKNLESLDINGGEGGIRTHGRVTPSTVFKSVYSIFMFMFNDGQALILLAFFNSHMDICGYFFLSFYHFLSKNLSKNNIDINYFAPQNWGVKFLNRHQFDDGLIP